MERVEQKIRVLAVIPDGGNKVSMIFAHKEIARIAAAGYETKTFMFATSLNPAKIWRETIRLKKITQLYLRP